MIDFKPVRRRRVEQNRQGFMKAHRTAASLRKSGDQETIQWIVFPKDDSVRGQSGA